MGRLRKKQIFSISPLKIIVAGKISIMYFDKTGTLTEEDLDVYGIRAVEMNEGEIGIFSNFRELKKVEELQNDNFTHNEELFIEAMASCHSLTRVSGQIVEIL